MKNTHPKPSLGTIEIRRVKLSAINPAPYNPRVELRPGDPEWAQLVASIEQFGYVDPLIWNKRTGNLVGGHQRLAVLRHKGVKVFDVSVVDLSEQEEKVLNLALNKIRGRWDQDGLAKLLAEISADTATISAALSGFNSEEIHRIVSEGDELLELLVPAAEEEEEDEGHGEGGGTKKAVEVVVETKSRSAARNLIKRLTAEGYACRTR